MKHHEFYRKYKVNYPPIANPFFSRKNWKLGAVMVVIAVLIEPLIMYKRHRFVPFTLDYYVQQVEYFLCVLVPFLLFLIWSHWQESTKRKRGYGWVGDFQVRHKTTSILFFYLRLAPGDDNIIKVDKLFFDKVRVGDFVQLRRDARGKIHKVSIIHSVSRRLAMSQG